jgi:2-furoate---CoA ligase
MIVLNLYQLFSFSTARYPDKLALVQDTRKWNYSRLSVEVDRVASSLHRLGLKNGDRVMTLLKNRIETVVVFWAVQKLGAIFAPINLRASTEEILHCMNDLETRFIIFEDASKHLILNQKFSERPLLIGLEDSLGDISYGELVKKGTTNVEPFSEQDDDIAVILYTSGTSGKPKGVPRSHKNEYAATIAHIIHSHYHPFEKTLGIPSLSHTIGLRSLLAMTYLNGAYFPFQSFDTYHTLKLIVEEGISCLFLTPTMYHEIVNYPQAKTFDFSSIHSIVYSGGPMPPKLISKCDELMNPDFFVNLYGSTEIFTLSINQDIRNKPGSCGKAGINGRLKLLKLNRLLESHFDWVTESDEVGVILVDISSPEAFKGYWNRPDATRKSINNGWYLTGDVGFLDKEGELQVVGRTDDMIISCGENIYPQEIEKVLIDHRSVKEVAVVGEEDERYGQIVTAFIVTDEQELTPQMLDYFCKMDERLPNYKRPRNYIFVKNIPKNSAGKILRRELRDGKYEEVL